VFALGLSVARKPGGAIQKFCLLQAPSARAAKRLENCAPEASRPSSRPWELTGGERPVPRPPPHSFLHRAARPPAQRRRHNSRIAPVNLEVFKIYGDKEGFKGTKKEIKG